MSPTQPRTLLAATALLCAAAALAPNTTPALLWALLPAGALLGTALLLRPAVASAGGARHAATIAAAALAVLVLLTLVGVVTTALTRLEPAWLAVATAAVATAAAAALSALGLAIATTTGPRPAGLLLALAVPLGLAFDAAVAAVLPVGFFIHGVTIACVLLAVALARLARASSVRHGAR